MAKKSSFLYQDVIDTVISKIENNEYTAGSKLPANEDLKSEFGVSMITLTKALRMLADQGFIRRVPGVGTFICDKLPNPAVAQTGRAPFVGLILEHVSTPFGLQMMYAIDQAAEAAGYRCLIRFSYGDRKRETREINMMRKEGASGIILMPCHGKNYSQDILKLYMDGFPAVLIDKKLHGISLPSIRTDNAGAIADLVNRLTEDGAEKIAMFSGGDEEVTSVAERCDGFRAECSRLGLKESFIGRIGAGRLYHNEPLSDRSLEEARGFLAEAVEKGIDSVISAEYSFVRLLMQAAEELDLDLGRKIRLCCIDEDQLAPRGAMFNHMKQDESAIGAKAFEVLEKAMAGEKDLPDSLIPAVYSEGWFK